MKQIANVWFKARDLSIWLLIAAGIVLPTGAGAEANSEPGRPERQGIQQRVEAVRRQLRAEGFHPVIPDTTPNADGKIGRPKTEEVTQWPNWPKWSNWNNWGNYWRNR